MLPSHFIVLDFEATCNEDRPPRPQEIIEFPSVLSDATSLEVIDTFESFVRPVRHPTLSEFCSSFTGIQQAEVDGAPLFADVLHRHSAWLRSHGDPSEMLFITCGDWDLKRMLPAQCKAAVPPLPRVPAPYRRWVNIKHVFADTLGERGRGMKQMMRVLGLPLEGRHHRGIDDCHNITRILKELIHRGASIHLP